jgi:hypothetical protein
VQNGYQFDHWVYDGNNWYDKEFDVPMSGPHTLVAYFSIPPSADLTVEAYDWPDTPVGIDVYIDGSYADTTSFLTNIGAMWHNMSVPYTQDGWCLYYVNFDNELLIYGMPDFDFYLPEGSHTITIYYITGK